MKERIRQALDGILERFKNKDIPETIAYAMFPIPDVPSAKWSLLNRTLMFLAGTQDARGFRQWHQMNRYVKRGSRAFHILVPYIQRIENQETEEVREVLRGFMCRPVFRYEDTDGDPIEYPRLELPELPLVKKAEQWGISIKAIPGNYKYYGYYASSRKEIALASKEECVFFHELAHCAHEKVKGRLKPDQDPLQEIVAELSAQALCRIAGKQPHDTLGNSYTYIDRYAQKLRIGPYAACLRVMSETERVLELILKGGPHDAQPA
jgi:hypothetical protein